MVLLRRRRKDWKTGCCNRWKAALPRADVVQKANFFVLAAKDFILLPLSVIVPVHHTHVRPNMTRQQSSCRRIFFGLILVQMLLVGCRGSAEEDAAALDAADAEEDASTPAAVATEAASAEEAIRMVLNAQTEAWNQGSIPAFMEGYAQTDSLRFASGGNVWYGWEETLQRYRDTYIDEGMMGTLTFDDLDIHLLSADHAVVFGRWSLARSETYTDVGGLFTLVFQQRPEGWRIVHDHTSTRSTLSESTDTLTTDENNGQSIE